MMLAAAFITFAILGWFYYRILLRQVVEYGGAVVGFNWREAVAVAVFTLSVLLSCVSLVLLYDTIQTLFQVG